MILDGILGKISCEHARLSNQVIRSGQIQQDLIIKTLPDPVYVRKIAYMYIQQNPSVFPRWDTQPSIHVYPARPQCVPKVGHSTKHTCISSKTPVCSQGGTLNQAYMYIPQDPSVFPRWYTQPSIHVYPARPQCVPKVVHSTKHTCISSKTPVCSQGGTLNQAYMYIQQDPSVFPRWDTQPSIHVYPARPQCVPKVGHSTKHTCISSKIPVCSQGGTLNQAYMYIQQDPSVFPRWDTQPSIHVYPARPQCVPKVGHSTKHTCISRKTPVCSQGGTLNLAYMYIPQDPSVFPRWYTQPSIHVYPARPQCVPKVVHST